MKKLIKSKSAWSLLFLYASIQSSTTDYKGKTHHDKYNFGKRSQNSMFRMTSTITPSQFNPNKWENHSSNQKDPDQTDRLSSPQQRVPTCVALFPILTTSNRVMFSIPFS